jgi:membrane-bound metal-dependent hydrolase YbcI (DUF457 family)
VPDLITHTAFAFFFSDKRYRNLFFLLLGAILPDVTRFLFLFAPDNHTVFWFFTALHSPVVLIVLAWLISYFFDEKIRYAAFSWIFFGVVSHLGLDLFQKHFGLFSYPWLFPFSLYGSSWGLFWPEAPLFIAPFLALAAVIFWLIRSKKLVKIKLTGR